MTTEIRLRALVWAVAVSTLGSLLLVFLYGVYLGIFEPAEPPGSTVQALAYFVAAIPFLVAGYLGGRIQGRAGRPLLVPVVGAAGCLIGSLVVLLLSYLSTLLTAPENATLSLGDLVRLLMWSAVGGVGALLALKIHGAKVPDQGYSGTGEW
jgi:MFS family permease